MQTADLFHPHMPAQPGQSLGFKNLHGASTGLVLSQLLKDSKQPLLIIAPDSLSVSYLIEELEFFGNHHHPILTIPDWETLPYDHFSPHQDIISERLYALHRLPLMQQGAIIVTIATLMHRFAPNDYLDKHSFILKIGDKLPTDLLQIRLTKAGYHHVAQVREHGEFAIRGSIIDLFPMGSKTPFRIDLFDDEVDSIRLFSPDTQRSTEKITEINLLPAKEFPLTEEAIDLFRQKWRATFSGNPLKSAIYQDISEGIYSPGIEYYLPFFFEKTATLFDYLPAKTCIITIGDILGKASEFWQEIEARFTEGRSNIERPLIEPMQLFIPKGSIASSLKQYARIEISQTPTEKNHRDIIEFATSIAPTLDIHYKASRPFAPLETLINDYHAKQQGRILFCVETMGRREVILQSFKSIGLSPAFFASWQDFLASDAPFGMVVAPIEEGFCLERPALMVLTEAHLYANRIMQRRLRKKTTQDPETLIRDLTELQLDDPIVHIDHGIGRYRGLETLKIGDQLGEFLSLEYQGGDKLYVPVASLHLISRYLGTNTEHTPIHKLGNEQWQRAKRRATEKVRDVAIELLDLYAKRAAREGIQFTIPQDAYASFAAGFPFEETPDQLQAIEAVFTDMAQSRPMDRIICGDVGFGKTEVALRAAFLAVQNDMQVAVLAPTTLLAQQLFDQFQNRFAEWPIQVGLLSRFRTGKEQKNTLEQIKEGKIDIVIGTHKLLQNDIQFKSLGLIIIDEEHRFGVKQKEKLKSLRTMADMLTLTATPIPRTLNMALSGIRDLSVIATPPAKRLSVKTFVHEYQNSIIQEAIRREIMRGGQVYFLHNEVSSIHKKAEEIKALVPESRVSIAHGQMHERELERIMSEFYHRHTNVLVCSTIIESGIDIPTANTIIINRADKFGLAQLHQLRGRVGRSHHQAYAYLLVPAKKEMTADAVKRLDAIASLDALGIGFTLATHDLEIRGAGELLGEDQSGDMEEVGFTLYMDLLSRAIDSLKAGHEPDHDQALLTHHSEIDLHVTALIPDHYLNDIQLRLLFYKRIANAKHQRELDDIQVEMIDRFGLLPDALKNLIAITELKFKANALGIIKIEANEKGGKLEFSDRPQVKPETIIRLIQTKTEQYRLDGPTRLRFALQPHELKERVTLVSALLTELEN